MTRLRALVLAGAVVVAGCGGDAGPESSGLTARAVILAFHNAGLLIPNERDNTQGNCAPTNLPCKALITTDAFSVHEWNTVKDAQRWMAPAGPGDAANGNVTVTFHTGGSAVEVDPAPYEKVLSDL